MSHQDFLKFRINFYFFVAFSGIFCLVQIGYFKVSNLYYRNALDHKGWVKLKKPFFSDIHQLLDLWEETKTHIRENEMTCG